MLETEGMVLSTPSRNHDVAEGVRDLVDRRALGEGRVRLGGRGEAGGDAVLHQAEEGRGDGVVGCADGEADHLGLVSTPLMSWGTPKGRQARERRGKSEEKGQGKGRPTCVS